MTMARATNRATIPSGFVHATSKSRANKIPLATVTLRIYPGSFDWEMAPVTLPGKAGDTVVVSGQFLIDSEASLKSTINRLATTTSTDPEPAP